MAAVNKKAGVIGECPPPVLFGIVGRTKVIWVSVRQHAFIAARWLDSVKRKYR
jgi:hypothetical protein